MLVHKCDRCKKRISDKERKDAPTAGIGYKEYEFCRKCGASIVRLLKSYKLYPRVV